MTSQHRNRSKFYAADNRQSIINTRIIGLNLEGGAATSFLFFKKELQTTWFQFEYSIASFRWEMRRSFQEIKDLHSFIQKDPALSLGRSLLQAQFPVGKDGDIDTMVLIERREMIEIFMKELLTVVDFKMYEPLDSFIEGTIHLMLLQDKLRVVVRALRSYIAKKKLHFRLFKFYSSELLSFVYTLENGIDIYDVSQCAKSTASAPEHSVLWLDVCEEPGLSRLCLAPREVYNLPRVYEDERLANGIFLSDIAEVRRGCSAAFYRTHTASWLQPELCMSIIASERNFFVQAANLFSSSEQRFFFMDMLNLLVLQALTPQEVKQRKKVFHRANHLLYEVDLDVLRRFSRNNRSNSQLNRISSKSSNIINVHKLGLYAAPSTSSKGKSAKEEIKRKLIRDSEDMLRLLLAGIEVDEETFSPRRGVCISSKLLTYQPDGRTLLINPTKHASPTSDDTSGSDSSADEQVGRSILIDDICEVRAGKISDAIDGGLFRANEGERFHVSIVSSESVIVLPLANANVRNNLIRKFQAFLQVHRDTEVFHCDAPLCFSYVGNKESSTNYHASSDSLDRHMSGLVPTDPLSEDEVIEINDSLGPMEPRMRESQESGKHKHHYHLHSAEESSPFAHSQDGFHGPSTSLYKHKVSAIRRSSTGSSKGQTNSLSDALQHIRSSDVDYY